MLILVLGAGDYRRGFSRTLLVRDIVLVAVFVIVMGVISVVVGVFVVLVVDLVVIAIVL